jgi:acyl carrier protein
MDNQQISVTMEHAIRIIRDLAREEELPAHLSTSVITPEDTIETLGLDSLGAVSLIERFEAEFDISLPDDFLDIADNITGIARRLYLVVQLEAEVAATQAESSQEAVDLCRVMTQ